MEILVCLLLVSFSLLGYYQFKRVVNPITIFISWPLSLILLGLWSNIFITDYSWKTFGILIYSYIMFAIGCLIGKKIKFSKDKRYEINFGKLRYCIVFLSICVDISVIIYFLDLATNIGFAQIFGDLSAFNLTMQGGFFKRKIYYQIMQLSIPLSLFILYYLICGKPKSRRILWFEFIICFIPFVSVRRDTLFRMIVLNVLLWYVLYIFNLSGNKVSEKLKSMLKIIFTIVIAVSFMSVTQKLLNKSYSITDMRILGISIPQFFITPISYLVGSFPYFNLKLTSGDVSYEGFLISTLRILYMYVQPIIGGNMNVTAPFDLEFINISRDASILFNTAPIQYYTLIEMGMFFPLFYLVLGAISANVYKKFTKFQGFSEALWLVIVLSILFWSIREYVLIYLNTWIMIITVAIVSKIILVRKR